MFLVVLVVFGARLSACEKCKLRIECEPNCETYYICEGVPFGGTSWTQCDAYPWACYVGGDFCRWAEKTDTSAEDQMLIARFSEVFGKTSSESR